MPLIQWSDQLSIGIDSVDKQHKVLINLLNKLNDAIAEGNADLILTEIFDGLSAYTVKHFAYEEELFKKYGYSGAEAHKHEHAELIKKVKNLRQKMDEGDSMVNVEVLDFLKEWLTYHILISDKAFASFLIEKGVT